MEIKIILLSFLVGIIGVSSQDVVPPHCTDEARNGNFDNNSTAIEKWETAPTKYGSVTMSLAPGVEGNAMRVTERYAWWASPTLHIDQGCFAEGDTLEFTAKIKLIDDNDMPLSCKPGQIWGKNGIIAGVCPLMTLKTISNSVGTEFDTGYIDVASVVAPFKTNDWNSMHGVYTVTKEFLESEEISLMFYKMEKEVGYIVDNVSIKKVEDGCAKLVKNGNAETGDARGWQYFGDDASFVAVDTQVFSLGSYHFVNSNRQDFDDGAITFLDQGCLDTESIYQISVKVKLTQGDLLVPCDYLGTSTTGGDIARCPMIHLVAKNSGGPRQIRALAAVSEPFSIEVNEWNELNSFFSFLPAELGAEDLHLYISGSPGGVDIHFDDLVLERVASNTYHPTSAPSVSKSYEPTTGEVIEERVTQVNSTTNTNA